MQLISVPGLPAGALWRYSSAAVAKSAAGIGVPSNSTATIDAPCVFFYVDNLAHLFALRHFLRRKCIQIMVAQVGASSEAPVFVEAGYANPIWATTLEIGVSGGSNMCYSTETALWLQSQPCHTRYSLSCFWPCAALICVPCRTVKPLPPRMNIMPAACWCAIMCWCLLAVCRLRRCIMVNALFVCTPRQNGSHA